MEWTDVKVRIGDLTPWIEDPRYITKDYASRIVISLEEFGQTSPLLIGPTNEVYDGRIRLGLLLEKYGDDYIVDAKRCSIELTEQDKIKLSIYIHKGATGRFNYDALANNYELSDLINWGFTERELLGDKGVDMEFIPENISITELRPHPKNYRKHPADQIAHIQASIKEHGFYRNIVLANDRVILAGHGVYEACKDMGMKEVPCIVLDIASNSVQALKILSGDNEIGHLAEIDDRALTDILKEIKDIDPDGLLGTGYDAMMLANLVMVTRPVSEIKDFDAAAEWVGMPEYDEGKKRFMVSIYFETEEDRGLFMEKHSDVSIMTRGAEIWSGWWPARERKDLKSVKFEA